MEKERFSNKDLEVLFGVQVQCDRSGNPIKVLKNIGGIESMIVVACLKDMIKTNKKTLQLWLYGEDGTYRGFISDSGFKKHVDKNTGFTFSSDFNGAKLIYDKVSGKYTIKQ